MLGADGAAETVHHGEDQLLRPVHYRRTLRVAKQSLGVGLGLSAAAMVVAALGYIPPAIGALLQEAIDVAVILNALRAGKG